MGPTTLPLDLCDATGLIVHEALTVFNSIHDESPSVQKARIENNVPRSPLVRWNTHRDVLVRSEVLVRGPHTFIERHRDFRFIQGL